MENDIRQIAKYETKCTGCGACVNVCPVHAITLVERNGYFLFPEIDQSKCTHCGLCLKKCPCAQPKPEPSRPTNEKIYGCYVRDEKERMRSSSGGVFQALAKYVIGKGGLVCGARFTDGCHLRHVLVDRVEDLPPLQGSKYLQSNVGDSYAKIKKAVQSGRMVLFVGTPCQVAGARGVIGDSELLITVDLCCHGVPPEKLFLQHIEGCINQSAGEILDVRFRDKNGGGWVNPRFVIETAGRRYDMCAQDDLYMKAFAQSLITRRSCAECRFSRLPRVGDFTIGDLWTVAEERLRIRDNKGVSLVIPNTHVAQVIFRLLRPEFDVVKEVPVQEVSNTNNLQQCWHTPHPNRQRFFDALYENTGGRVDELMAEYLVKSDGVCLLNYHDSHNNYGSVLTGYALQEKIKTLIGFPPVSIRLWPVYGGEPEAGDLVDFNRERIFSTEIITGAGSLDELNRYCRTFIVGPDAVWRNCGYVADFHWMFLSFARFSRNIASYAASFGFAKLLDTPMGAASSAVTDIEVRARKRLLKRFSHVSVRESSGVDLCRDVFDIDAEHVLDAVFLHDSFFYNKLIGCDARYHIESYNALYILNPSAVSAEVLSRLSGYRANIYLRESSVDYEHRDSVDKDGNVSPVKGVSVSDWLRGIRDCDLFVTDSFHGTCFAIIFKRQFISIRPPAWAGSERVESLFKMLGISSSRFVKTVSDLECALAHPIDYSAIEPKLNEWIAKSEAYLKEVLADNTPNKTRDWLESVEMAIEEVEKRTRPRPTLKQIFRNLAIRVYGRGLRCGVVACKHADGAKVVSVAGLNVLRVSWSNGKRQIRFLGLRMR